MRTDIHQHLWSEPLVEALASRREFPFVRTEHGLEVLYLADERPYVIELAGEEPASRAALVGRDGLDRALLCLSSPLGIEWLPRAQAQPLIEAYHAGALALGEPFGVWGAVALERPDPEDVDRILQQGCVGLSLPAGALASTSAIAHVGALLTRLQERGAPLLVHPGPAHGPHGGEVAVAASLTEPLWWPAMTRYVACMQAAWLAFLVAGRSSHPELRVVFTMLAGLAPMQLERLSSRGGPSRDLADPLTFYDTSSYGPAAIAGVSDVVGVGQLLYGSDRPVVDPGDLDMPGALDWDAAIEGTERALGPALVSSSR
jgi:hypothetical protein